MENSSAGQSMCIGGDGAGVAGLGPPFSLSLSLYFFAVCVFVQQERRRRRKEEEEACQRRAGAGPSTQSRSQQEKRETGRLMAAIRARIKMVGPRQLYRLGSDGAVGMRLSTHRRKKEKKKPSSRHSITGIAPPVLALPVYLRIRRQNGRRRTSS